MPAQEHLLALHKKLEFVRTDEAAARAAAMQDIAPELERLRAKAVAKSREFLMARCLFWHCSFRDCLLGSSAPAEGLGQGQSTPHRQSPAQLSMRAVRGGNTQLHA